MGKPPSAIGTIKMKVLLETFSVLGIDVLEKRIDPCYCLAGRMKFNVEKSTFILKCSRFNVPVYEWSERQQISLLPSIFSVFI